MPLEIWYVIIGLSFPLAFFTGVYVGEMNARKTLKREIDAGREYLKALDEAYKGIKMGERIQVGLVIERQPREAQSGHATIGSYEKREQENNQ